MFIACSRINFYLYLYLYMSESKRRTQRFYAWLWESHKARPSLMLSDNNSCLSWIKNATEERYSPFNRVARSTTKEGVLILHIFKDNWLPRRIKSSVAGPGFWGLINPQWPLCTKGRRQSPINVEPDKLLYDPYLRALHLDKHKVRVCVLLLPAQMHKLSWNIGLYYG